MVVMEHEKYNLENFFNLSIDMLSITDMNGLIVKANDALAKSLGYAKENIIGKSCFDFIHPEDIEPARKELKNLSQGIITANFECRIRNANGRYIWTEWSAYPDSAANLIYTVARNITQKKKTYSYLVELSQVDPLTKLLNRRGFEKYSKRELRRALRYQYSVCLILIDVNDFKNYNDTYGHLQGDECLKSISHTLSEYLARESDVVGRFGGDEFIVFLPHHNEEEGKKIAATLQEKIKNLEIPHLNNHEKHVTVNVGLYSTIPSQSTTLKYLIEKSDQALYEAKHYWHSKKNIADL